MSRDRLLTLVLIALLAAALAACNMPRPNIPQLHVGDQAAASSPL